VPAPQPISSSLVGVTDRAQRARIKAQGLYAHVSWAQKKLPYSWDTAAGYRIVVTSLAYEEPHFKVTVLAFKPPETRLDSDGNPFEYREPIWVDNPLYFYNPPILRGEDRVEDPVGVAKTIIEQAIGVT